MIRVSEDRVRDVEAFLHAEARLLDEGRFQEWLALVADDVRYEAHAPTFRGAGDRAPAARVPLFREDAISLRSRVAQFSDPELTVAENPRSIDRRFVANVEVFPGAGTDEVEVLSNLLVRRCRGVGTEPFLMSAARRDVLRWSDGSFRLLRRSVTLDEVVIQARSLSLLF